MWSVVTEGPIKIDKEKSEWKSEDKRKNNLDNLVMDILYRSLDDSMFNYIISSESINEIWDRLTQLYEDNAQTKENKITISTKQFDNFKMCIGETMNEFYSRFSQIVTTLSILGKTYNNREISIKIMHALPREWDIKSMAYEFELNSRIEEEHPSAIIITKDLVTADEQLVATEVKTTSQQLRNDAMALIVKKFGKFIKKSNSNSNNSNINDDKKSNDGKFKVKCFNSGILGYYKAECRKSKCDEKKKDEEKELKAPADGKAKWNYSDSDSSSNDNYDDEVACFIVREEEEESMESEVFDFSSKEFSRKELVAALNDMVIEYKKISESYNEIKSTFEMSQPILSQTLEQKVFENNNEEVSSKNEMLKEKDSNSLF
ncbi:uncharacterized protein LOC124913303 [Impatiens glandulifera]|uniref:uncharacterized protein LOC124913303 n=1 Tax=Impatiens glandulifera TaxID=253017 RepID=UPI001FB0641E|nr:uncharacterized protein LOC124913303 [Impatiens glandulifera]